MGLNETLEILRVNDGWHKVRAVTTLLNESGFSINNTSVAKSLKKLRRRNLILIREAPSNMRAMEYRYGGGDNG